jgi:uncharacterized protein (TIGR02646 family)
MIHVPEKPEPPDFDDKVRQPGARVLARGTAAKLTPHWTKCLDDLMREYDGICAYVCIKIPPVTGSRSVEHFAPKSKHRNDAYEWSNYRLVCSVMNSRKRDFEDVLDPFDQIDGWFRVQMTTMKVAHGTGLTAAQREAVKDTIKRLKLNHKDCRDARSMYYDEYINGHVDFDFLSRHSPFVAREVQRQGLRRPND